jgi:hypothetical protein
MMNLYENGTGMVGRGLVPRIVETFVAGVCSRCGASCAGQVVTMHINTPGKYEALCAGCMARDAEKGDGQIRVRVVKVPTGDSSR